MGSSIRYIFIDQPNAAMQAALDDLAQDTSLALDIEMENSYHHYGLHIALIQISTSTGQNYIFDPLSKINIKQLGAILTNPKIELIMHDTDFDQRACYQIYRWQLNHLFDTKIAAQFCGYRQFGLGSLLQDLLNVNLNKTFQRFDWLKRPIRKDALEYAANDTAWLHALKNMLTQRLKELGRLGWAQEEFRRLETCTVSEPAIPTHYRIKNSASLTPRQLAILRFLTAFRDEIARRMNRPVHYIFRDAHLLQFAVHPPANEVTMRSVTGMHPVMYRKDTIRLFLQAVARGRAAPAEIHPLRRKRPTKSIGCSQKLKAMQEWRRQKAAALNLEPYLLLANDILRWAARKPLEPAPAVITAQLRLWQRELLWNEFQTKFITPDLS